MSHINDEWKHWLVVYMGSETSPEIVHIAGYKEPIREHNVINLMEQVRSHPQFGIHEEYWKDLKVGELPDKEARMLLEAHAPEMDTMVEQTSAAVEIQHDE